ncbi:MAG: alpha/beta fold hydrolase [Blastococcus sp.]
MAAAAEAGYPAYGLSLRGHGGSSGRLRISRLGNYVDDVIAVATSLPAPPVLVGHSMAAWRPTGPARRRRAGCGPVGCWRASRSSCPRRSR